MAVVMALMATVSDTTIVMVILYDRCIVEFELSPICHI